jgi:acetylglutamate kinase
MLERLQITTSFEDGFRVTDKATVEVVEMVLAGSINKNVVADIQRAGGRAVGISGKDGNLCLARKLTRTRRDPDSNIERVIDLGFVGEPERIDPQVLETILRSESIPVVAPIGVSATGDTYNINADTFAGAIAVAVKAKRLLLLTDVQGVLDEQGGLIEELQFDDIARLASKGIISGGMIPKLESCAAVVAGGVEGVIILDGRVPHCVLLELFTPHGVGTRISRIAP